MEKVLSLASLHIFFGQVYVVVWKSVQGWAAPKKRKKRPSISMSGGFTARCHKKTPELSKLKYFIVLYVSICFYKFPCSAKSLKSPVDHLRSRAQWPSGLWTAWSGLGQLLQLGSHLRLRLDSRFDGIFQ